MTAVVQLIGGAPLLTTGSPAVDPLCCCHQRIVGCTAGAGSPTFLIPNTVEVSFAGLTSTFVVSPNTTCPYYGAPNTSTLQAIVTGTTFNLPPVLETASGVPTGNFKQEGQCFQWGYLSCPGVTTNADDLFFRSHNPAIVCCWPTSTASLASFVKIGAGVSTTGGGAPYTWTASIFYSHNGGDAGQNKIVWVAGSSIGTMLDGTYDLRGSWTLTYNAGLSALDGATTPPGTITLVAS